MLGTLAATTLVAFTSTAAPHGHHRHHVKHRRGCQTAACDRRADAAWRRHHPPPAPVWAIPEAIVMCESGGANLSPNSAGAAGYYQIIPGTWASHGGSTPDDASQHPKSEQDRVARRIWAEGGPGEWVCKA
jgi:hypothetical protein